MTFHITAIWDKDIGLLYSDSSIISRHMANGILRNVGCGAEL